jgi:hypothetical protein
MSDEKRALTRHSAPPSEADYEAILAAVMETGRGRWFLHEFAGRNRHAETRGVLTAIQRIEGLLRAQGAETPETSAPAGGGQIGEAIARARQMIGTAEGGPDAFAGVIEALDAAQARIRTAASRLHDAAAALHEDGGPVRICNDLDRRTQDVETGLAQIDDAAGDMRILVALLHEIESQIGEDQAGEGEAIKERAAQAPAPVRDALPPSTLPAPAIPPSAMPMLAVPQDEPAAAQAATTASHPDTPSPAAAEPVAGPADFLLEPLPEEPAFEDYPTSKQALPQAPIPETAAAPERAPVPENEPANEKPAPEPGPLRLDSFDPLAPLRTLSDEEKIALFS